MKKCYGYLGGLRIFTIIFFFFIYLSRFEAEFENIRYFFKFILFTVFTAHHSKEKIDLNLRVAFYKFSIDKQIHY